MTHSCSASSNWLKIKTCSKLLRQRNHGEHEGSLKRSLRPPHVLTMGTLTRPQPHPHAHQIQTAEPYYEKTVCHKYAIPSMRLVTFVRGLCVTFALPSRHPCHECILRSLKMRFHPTAQYASYFEDQNKTVTLCQWIPNS